jgi:site-specific recombinase XerD
MRSPNSVTQKDWSPESYRWYKSRLGAFIKWCKDQGVDTLEAVDPPFVRRYIEHLQTRASRYGKPLDTLTIHGHVRQIRTLLFWAASERLIDERIPRRIKLPKKEQKVLHVFSDEQLELMFKAASETPTPLRDTALLSILLDTGCRARYAA